MTSGTTTITSAGPFSVIVDDGGSVLASGWTADLTSLLPLIHSSLRPSDVRELADLGEVSRAVAAYHAGDLAAVDGVPVRQTSGEFLSHAWDVLRTIGPGTTVTYAQFAALSGRPAATRAAAAACARNAAALFVPCHRVLRTGGALGGFRWGLPVKRWLIEHESADLRR